MSEKVTQLIFEAHKSQSQYVYFQLGVAVSAIAFAVHETKELPLSQAPWPLGLGVALWAMSFVLGGLSLEARSAGLTGNANYLLADGDAQKFGIAGKEGIKQAIENIRTGVEARFEAQGRWAKWQKWTLFLGALGYVAGHLMRMASLPT